MQHLELRAKSTAISFIVFRYEDLSHHFRKEEVPTMGERHIEWKKGVSGSCSPQRPVSVLRQAEHSTITLERFPVMRPTRILKKLFLDGANLFYKTLCMVHEMNWRGHCGTPPPSHTLITPAAGSLGSWWLRAESLAFGQRTLPRLMLQISQENGYRKPISNDWGVQGYEVLAPLPQ